MSSSSSEFEKELEAFKNLLEAVQKTARSFKDVTNTNFVAVFKYGGLFVASVVAGAWDEAYDDLGSLCAAVAKLNLAEPVASNLFRSGENLVRGRAQEKSLVEKSKDAAEEAAKETKNAVKKAVEEAKNAFDQFQQLMTVLKREVDSRIVAK